MARGKYFTLTKQHLTQIEKLAGFGMTEAAIACVIGCSADTLTRRKQSRKSVAEAIARGKAIGESTVGEALFKRCKAGDVRAIQWYEMTRSGRSTRVRNELTGKDGEAIVVEQATTVFYIPDNGRDKAST